MVPYHHEVKVTLNTAKGLPAHLELEDVLRDLEGAKWYLWHGNVHQALERLRWVEMSLEVYVDEDHVAVKLYRYVSEFQTYILNNRDYIPNYGDRYHYGEIISTAFVESTVNELISRRMVKKQQMRWTREGAHLLLQTRIKTLDGNLRDKFCEWYPGMVTDSTTAFVAVAADSRIEC